MIFINRRTAIEGALAGTAGMVLDSLPAMAQELPGSARIVVGFPPGGAVDIVARRLGEQLVGKLAKGVIVDNRPGAAGRIAVDIARRSPPEPAGWPDAAAHRPPALGLDCESLGFRR